jgi:hypothetical protein
MKDFARTTNDSLICGLVALAAVGCDDGTPSTGSSSNGSSSGTGSSGNPPAGVVLTPSATGYVSGNSAGVVGSWYVYADGFGSDGKSGDGDCVAKGMFPASACSVVTSPTPGVGSFPPSAEGAMCLTGTAAKVLNGANMMPDYSDLFGEGIGLDLNNPGGDAGATAGFFDGSKYTGVSFDITFPSGTPQANLRVQFPTMETLSTGDSAYWGGAKNSGSPITSASTYAFKWADVGGPMYLTNPPAFDKTKIQAIQFAVYTDTMASVPVSFCINNLTLTTM